MMAMPCGVLVACIVFKAYGASHQGFLDDLRKQMKGEIGLSPDRFDIFLYVFGAFFIHVVLHWCLLHYWIIPRIPEVHTEYSEHYEELFKCTYENHQVKAFSEQLEAHMAIEGLDDLDKEELDKLVLVIDTNGKPLSSPFTNIAEESFPLTVMMERTYASTGGKYPRSYFNTNPVNCLRSKYIYGDSPPCVFFRLGKEHLIKPNPQIGIYFQSSEYEEPPATDSEESAGENDGWKTAARKKAHRMRKHFAKFSDGHHGHHHEHQEQLKRELSRASQSDPSSSSLGHSATS
jgi:hypothetical protein